MDLLEEYVKRASDPDSQQEADFKTFQGRTILQRQEILNGEAYKLFVDLSSPYPRRLHIVKYFWVLSQEKAGQAHRSVREGIASAFLLLYTKVKTSPIGDDVERWKIISLGISLSQVSRMVLPWAAIGLFHKSHREAYNDIDVKITYAIFCSTALLEAYSFIPYSLKRSPEMVALAQYSLLGYFASSRKHSLFGCEDFLTQRVSGYSRRITELVLRYLKDGWNKKIQDAASYRSFNDNRGHWALEGNQDMAYHSMRVSSSGTSPRISASSGASFQSINVPMLMRFHQNGRTWS